MTPEEQEARKALTCLFITADEHVARDVRDKVLAAFHAIREEATQQRGKYHRWEER